MSLISFGLRFLQLVDRLPRALEAFQKVKFLLFRKLSTVISPPPSGGADGIDKELLTAIHKAYTKKFADLDRMIQKLEYQVKAKDNEIQILKYKLARAASFNSLNSQRSNGNGGKFGGGNVDFKDLQAYAGTLIPTPIKLYRWGLNKVSDYLASYNDKKVDMLVNDETLRGNLAHEYRGYPFAQQTSASGESYAKRKRTFTK